MHITPGQGCSLGDQWVDFPVVDGGHPVTATQTVETIADRATEPVLNSSGMTIDATVSQLSCRWGGRNPDFDFQVGFRFGPANREGTLSMGAGITVGQSQTLGFVLRGQDWQSSYSGQCTFTEHEVIDATRSVRGEVSCPVLDVLTDMPTTQNHEVCILNGYYAFENCTPP